MKKFLDIFKGLFSPKLKSVDNSYFLNIIEEGDVEVFKAEFEKKNKDIEIGSATILFEEACYKNQLDIVKYMLTSPNAKIFHNIHLETDKWIKEACEMGHTKIVKYLFNDPKIQKHEEISNM